MRWYSTDKPVQVRSRPVVIGSSQPNQDMHATRSEGSVAYAKDFLRRDLQVCSADQDDAALRTKVSEAQEAPFASSGVWRNQSRIRAAAQPAVSALRCDCEVLEPESSHSAGHTRLTRQQRMQVLKA